VTINTTVSDRQAVSRETSRYMVTVNLPILTADEERRVATKDISESIFGYIAYNTGFGQTSLTNFCATRDANSPKWSDEHCAVGPGVDFTQHPH
jgi:hypothetical protein